MHKMCSHPLPQTTTPIHIWCSNPSNLCNNSWVATLLTLICLSKLHVFYKVKCHIYYRICEFLNHLTSIKLYYHFLLGLLFKKIIYLFIFDSTGSLLLGGFFYRCSQWGLLLAAVRVLLIAVFSFCGVQAPGCAGFSRCSSWALEHSLNSCGMWAKLLPSMWSLPGPGIKPVSLALAVSFFSTEPPGKLFNTFFLMKFSSVVSSAPFPP